MKGAHLKCCLASIKVKGTSIGTAPSVSKRPTDQDFVEISLFLFQSPELPRPHSPSKPKARKSVQVTDYCMQDACSKEMTLLRLRWDKLAHKFIKDGSFTGPYALQTPHKRERKDGEGAGCTETWLDTRECNSVCAGEEGKQLLEICQLIRDIFAFADQLQTMLDSDLVTVIKVGLGKTLFLFFSSQLYSPTHISPKCCCEDYWNLN